MPRVIVNPGDPIVSSWGNAVSDRSVLTFTSAADRNTQWPTPLDGALSYTSDSGTLWVRRAGVWAALPRGTIAQATAVTSSTGTTTNVDWFSAPPVTVDGTRRIKISYAALLNAGTVNDIVALRLMEASTVLQSAQARFAAIGGAGQTSLASVWQAVPTAGTHTYKLNVSVVGSGPATGIAGAAQPAELIIEDIGT